MVYKSFMVLCEEVHVHLADVRNGRTNNNWSFKKLFEVKTSNKAKGKADILRAALPHAGHDQHCISRKQLISNLNFWLRVY